jgi:hypothetical protein
MLLLPGPNCRDGGYGEEADLGGQLATRTLLSPSLTTVGFYFR